MAENQLDQKVVRELARALFHSEQPPLDGKSFEDIKDSRREEWEKGKGEYVLRARKLLRTLTNRNTVSVTLSPEAVSD